MGINLGDSNKIKNSIIAEKVEGETKFPRKKSFYEKHPIVCAFCISLAAGVILLFSFWSQAIAWIEGWF